MELLQPELNPEADSIYQQAVAFVLKSQDISCSGLQRHLCIGYGLALQLKERMEKSGVLSGIEVQASPEHVIIKVIDFNEAGSYAVTELVDNEFSGVEIITVNADAYMSMRSIPQQVPQKEDLPVGIEIQTEVADQLRQQFHSQIEEALRGAHIVFVVTNMADANKCDGAAVIVQIVREQGALSIAVVYELSSFGNTLNQKISDEWTCAAALHADALFVIPQIKSREPDTDVNIASEIDSDAITSREIIFNSIRRIVYPLTTPGFINVDYADFCRGLTGTSKNVCAIIKPASGKAQGQDRAEIAMARALAHPSFREHLSQANGVLYIITGNPKDVKGREVKQISREIQAYVSEDCACLCSIYYDQNMSSDTLNVEIFASKLPA